MEGACVWKAEDKITIPKFSGARILKPPEREGSGRNPREGGRAEERREGLLSDNAGLGSKPLAAVMEHKKHPKKIWDGLFERYASVDTFSRANVQKILTRMRYSDQKMDEYISEFESLATKLDAMNASMDEGLLITLFFEPFGSEKDRDYGSAIAALQTKEALTWQQVSSRITHRYQGPREALDQNMHFVLQKNRSHRRRGSVSTIRNPAISRKTATSGRQMRSELSGKEMRLWIKKVR